jgi:acyl carrier protein
MDMNVITDRIKRVTSEVLKIDADDVTADANFIFDLGANSMQSVALVAAFEEEFDIEMEEDKALDVQTVSDAAEFIAQYIN